MSTAIVKSDNEIEANVRTELGWDLGIVDHDIEASVHDGIVTLTGTVSSYPKKLAAREAAHRVHGVLDVVDNVRVRIPSAWERPDETVAKTVRNALKWDVLVPDERITSTVSSGVVTLQGNVDTWAQRWDAERAIERLIGVRSVINQITVGITDVDAARIKRGIEEALERQAEREAKRIGVSVRDGIVILSGTVRSWSEKNAIERVAG